MNYNLMTGAPSEPIMFCHSEVFFFGTLRRNVGEQKIDEDFIEKLSILDFVKANSNTNRFSRVCISGGRRHSSIINVASSWNKRFNLLSRSIDNSSMLSFCGFCLYRDQSRTVKDFRLNAKSETFLASDFEANIFKTFNLISQFA